MEGFAPECAVVTHGGGKELAEKLYIRPTSETIIYTTFAKWIQSHRDLPLKINQWANIIRWEMRTRPFLRTLEFLWQEGHTAHATKDEADAMARDALQMYVDFDREFLALPVLQGKKPDHDKFAGALYTLTTEALARDGKAIQAGTSHNLGQGFSEAYDLSFLDEKGTAQRPWITSWGASTRLIGTVIVVHGDAKGLRLPPSLAPIQIVIVPIYKTDDEKAKVLAACDQLKLQLGPELRVKIDARDEKSPGFKFNEWEVKGVPLRMEIGPKDLEKKAVMLCRRDTGTKESLAFAQCEGFFIQSMLQKIQESLYDQAKQYMDDHTYETDSYEELKKWIDGEGGPAHRSPEDGTGGGGFVWAPWDGTLKSANMIKDKTKATIRMIAEDSSKAKGKKDLVSGEPAKEWALFAKAY